MATEKRPVLSLIAGHNGAGKSSVGRSLLPLEAASQPIFDGDQAILTAFEQALRQTPVRELAQEMAVQEAMKLFRNLYQQAIREQTDFAYEGHFVGEGAFDILRQFKEAGFQINMMFMGLDSLEQSRDRVAQRVAMGGHNVAPWVVEFNYENNPKLIDRYLPLLDRLIIYNTSGVEPVPVLQYEQGQLLFKTVSPPPPWLSQWMPQLLAQPLLQTQNPEQTTTRHRTPKRDQDQGFSY